MAGIMGLIKAARAPEPPAEPAVDLENVLVLKLVAEEEAVDQQIADTIEQMNKLSTATMHESHANRMLALDREWLVARGPQ